MWWMRILGLIYQDRYNQMCLYVVCTNIYTRNVVSIKIWIVQGKNILGEFLSLCKFPYKETHQFEPPLIGCSAVTVILYMDYTKKFKSLLFFFSFSKCTQI